jgi:glycosyltransferase involved in cell wall biosynthesis
VHGPATIVADGLTGWLIRPDDEDALFDALVTAARGEESAGRVGRHAQKDSRRYGWAEIARRFASLREELLASSLRQQLRGGGAL